MENAKLMVRRCEGKILAAAPKIEPTDLAGMTATIKQKRVDELKIEARTSLEHKKHSHAVSALEQVLLIHPDDKEAQRLLQEATVSAHDERIVDVEKVQPQEATTATDTSKPAPDPYDPAGARQFAVRLPADEDRVLAKANTPKEPNPFGDLETDVDPFALFDYSYGGGSASSKRKGGEVEKPPPPTVEERTLARVERRVKMDRPDDLFAEFDYSPGSGSAVAKGDHSGSTLRVGGKEQRVIANSIITQADARGDVTVGQNLEYRRFERLKALGYIGEDSNTGQWHFETRVRATPGNESYETIVENPFKHVQDEPLSTFSIDVDTASYSNVRRFLNQGQLPPKSAVRIEELVNYFDYDYTPPEDRETPFAAHVEVASCPWTPDHQLARVALKGWEMAKHERPATNLVFLVDVSGSMQPENKLPLLVQGMKALTRQLDERDRVAIAVYAGNSGLVLESTPGHERRTILSALTRLRAGGSTNGGEGIQLAYNVARENFIKKGVNRVILATDGDFNVGITDQGSLTDLIEREAKSGVFLTVLGFGMGNLKDSTLEQLADKGNGNYAYIDTFNEARKVLVKDLMGTLVTIAKDVKIQVEFNPANVAAYRLIGYENRMLAKEDFNDDTKDAGEIGAGHTVTALYELVPVGVALPRPGVDALRYGDQTPEPEAQEPPAHRSDELLLLKLRYKQPDGDTSSLIEAPVKKSEARAFDAASQDFKFASAVASFGMVLRDSKHRGLANYQSVLDWAEDGIGKDPHGYRTEFFNLVKNARSLAQ
ncbi:MAG: VWA domain-containing protein [bacterium]|nr:VWA domain-containing protein [bacterium]